MCFSDYKWWYWQNYGEWVWALYAIVVALPLNFISCIIRTLVTKNIWLYIDNIIAAILLLSAFNSWYILDIEILALLQAIIALIGIFFVPKIVEAESKRGRSKRCF